MMKKFYFILLLLLLYISLVQSTQADPRQQAEPRNTPEVRYRMIWDKDLSSYAGAHNIITLHKGIYEVENSILKTKWFEEDNFMNKSAGIIYRLGKSILIENVIDHMSFLTQHEVFGHGARFREIGFRNNKYKLHLVFPYGNSHGQASTGDLSPPRFISSHEHLAMIIGGSSSNTVLSNVLRYKWLERQSINFRETLLYLISSNDLSSYILRTKHGLRSSSHNDIENYLRVLNAQHGFFNEDAYALSLDHLSNHSLIQVLDPFQYLSLFTYFVNYIWSGKESLKLPMIPILGLKYLPSFHLGLSPFGSEFYFDNFFVYKDKIFNFFIRYGEPTFHRFWGLGFESLNLINHKRLTLSSRLNLWNQPPLILGEDRASSENSTLGGSLFITAFYKITNTKPQLSLVGEIGYKSSGYVQGEMLSEGITLRVGLGFHVFKK